jgi:hypothetical protein
MDTPEQQLSTALGPLTYAWLGLVALTLISLGLGQWFHGTVWLQLVVAAIVWLKGMVVANQFIEARLAHPFIRRVLMAFIGFTPLALGLIAFFGSQFAKWATL